MQRCRELQTYCPDSVASLAHQFLAKLTRDVTEAAMSLLCRSMLTARNNLPKVDMLSLRI